MRLVSVRFQHEGASAKLTTMGDGRYSVTNVFSKFPGMGHARCVMQQLVDYADKHQLKLILTVQEYRGQNGRGFNNEQLEAFYSKFGFVRHSNSFPPHIMYRNPTETD